MNKLKLRSTLNHKATDHSPYNVEVEKVVTLYGNDFENMKSKPYENNPYYDDNPVIKEKVFSAFISVDNINDRLMGVITVQVSGELTDSELEEFREYLTGQMSDGVGESLEQRKIATSDYGDIYVSFWNSGNDWSMQTEEEFNMSQTEEIQPGMTM